MMVLVLVFVFGSGYDGVDGWDFFCISYVYKGSVYFKECCNMTFEKK